MSISPRRRQLETLAAALVAVAIGIVGLSSGTDQLLGPKFVALERIARLKKPVYLTQPRGPGSQLYVVQKTGAVRILSNDRLQRRPFLDIRRRVKSSGKGDEQGLLSIAFSPDYTDSGLFYTAYTDRRDALRVVEFRRSAEDPLVADPSSARTLLRIPQPTTKHHGGLLLFGPDGNLYVGAGDGGPSGDPDDVAQDKRMLRGKILRIHPREGQRPQPRRTRKGRLVQPKPAPYTVPKDNPFVGRPGRDEIWAYGLRNPWRFAFDNPTATIAIADVGNNRYEEVNFLSVSKARGANFGWSAYEAFAPFRGDVKRSRTVLPVFAYPHGPGCAVTGGYVVRDPRLDRIKGRDLAGRYLFGDYCSGKLFAFRPRPRNRGGKLRFRAGRERSFRFKVPFLTSFGRDNQGRIYVLTEKSLSRREKPTPGAIYRLDPRRKEISD
jgi:Glucose / Sorbosone dehydrogenase